MQMAFNWRDPAIEARHAMAGAAVGQKRRRVLTDKAITPHGNRDVVLTDHEVELVRQVYEMGGITIRQLADKMEVSRGSIGDIISFRRRSYAS
jgi:predicted DNA-binding protein (UPF0251 family)